MHNSSLNKHAAYFTTSVCDLFLHLKIENNQMKRKPILVVLVFILLSAAGCKKCYYCQNSCSICQNANFRILVESQNYGAAYYQLYLDTLIGNGYTCKDTTFDRDFQTCAESTHTLNNNVTLAGEQGYTCTAVQ
jgi:hypothetical protein